MVFGFPLKALIAPSILLYFTFDLWNPPLQSWAMKKTLKKIDEYEDMAKRNYEKEQKELQESKDPNKVL